MIHLRHFKLQKIDFDNIDHYLLVKKLSRDAAVTDYISHDLATFLKKEENYVVLNEQDRAVGIVGDKIDEKDRVMELWYMITKEQRGRGIADHLLGEVTPYFIEYCDIHDIKLLIDRYNHASIKCAQNNGYNIYKMHPNRGEYRYFGEEKGKSV